MSTTPDITACGHCGLHLPQPLTPIEFSTQHRQFFCTAPPFICRCGAQFQDWEVYKSHFCNDYVDLPEAEKVLGEEDEVSA